MSNWQIGEGEMALTHNPNSEYTSARHQVLVASPHLHGTTYDRKVALVVEGGRGGFRGVEVNKVFRQSLMAAQESLRAKPLSRLSMPKPVALSVIDWGPGELEGEIRSGVWMPTSTTFATVRASQDNLWVNLVRGIGRSVLRDSLGIKRFPKDIRVN
jgi:putative AlgH/UPF0301 family transcriptional regulator